MEWIQENIGLVPIIVGCLVGLVPALIAAYGHAKKKNWKQLALEAKRALAITTNCIDEVKKHIKPEQVEKMTKQLKDAQDSRDCRRVSDDVRRATRRGPRLKANVRPDLHNIKDSDFNVGVEWEW